MSHLIDMHIFQKSTLPSVILTPIQDAPITVTGLLRVFIMDVRTVVYQ